MRKHIYIFNQLLTRDDFNYDQQNRAMNMQAERRRYFHLCNGLLQLLAHIAVVTQSIDVTNSGIQGVLTLFFFVKRVYEREQQT